MADYKHTFYFLILFCVFISCGKNDRNENASTTIISPPKKEQKTIVKEIFQKKDTTFQTSIDSTRAIKESVLRKQNYKRKKVTNVTEKQTTAFTSNQLADQKTTISTFFYLKKILEQCKIGVLMTQNDLETNFKIPKDAMKLIKSVRKIGPDELYIKWKSTWLVEKISDTKFNDGKLKLRFEKNRLYTSGNAIAIKYEKKLYSNLVLIGQSAYIPTVKGYYWQIGKD